MAQDIVMPDLGMDMEEALLVNWLKNVGDSVKKGELLAEVETDKTTVEVESPVEGTILALNAEPGQQVRVGSVIGQVGAVGEATAQAPAPANGDASAPEASTPPAQEPAPDAQTPSQTRPPDAPPDSQQAPQPAEPQAQDERVPQEPPSTNGAAPVEDGARVKVSPVARKVAEERGIDLRTVRGTGPGGRIVKEDVEGHTPPLAQPAAASAPVQQPGTAPAAPTTPTAAPVAPTQVSLDDAPPTIAPATYGKLPDGPDVEIVEVSKLRARIGVRMVQSKQQVPHFYVTSVVDVGPMLALRKQLNDSLAEGAAKISVNDMIVKAAALALVRFPNFNTHFYGDRLAVHKRANVGIAVALDNGGLMNVVAKDADRTSLGVLAQRNRDMIARARDGKVKPDDVSGSTFTVSNLGPYGVDNFIAIVNPPESAILAVGAGKPTPAVLEDGSLGVKTTMKITISVDHRVGNGAEAGEFMQYLTGLLESPMRLLV